MKPNVGNLDRILRLVVGVVLLALFVVLPAPLKWLGLIGIVPIATALVRFCPAYLPFGINTCEKK